MSPVRLCLEVIPWPDTTLVQAIEGAAHAGFGCLDLSSSRLDEYLSSAPLVQLDYHLRAQRLYVAAIGGTEPLPVDDRQALLLAQARLLQVCMHLDALGGGILLICPRPPAKAPGGESGGEAQVLRTLSALAAPFDVLIAVESSSPTFSARLVDQTARPNVVLALEAETLSGEAAALSGINLDRLALVHLGEVAAAQSELRRTCTWLAAHGFSGPYSVRPARGGATFSEAAHEAHRAAAALFTTQ